MKAIVLILFLVAMASSSKVNTTNFFEKKLDHELNYETYSGY
jgi:hypothetical protein